MTRWLHLVMTAWAGSLWTICGIVAPGLFAVLPDRHVAGELAGYFFSVATWLGVFFGLIVLSLIARSTARGRTNVLLALAAMLFPVVSELGVRALMNTARAAGNMSRFGMLHGVSVLLFGVACVSALVLVWRLSGATNAQLAVQSGNTIRG